MITLINTSNLIVGGALQVADSICSLLYQYPWHSFIVVLSSVLDETKKKIERFDNVSVFTYDICKTKRLYFSGRDFFLDKLVKENNVDIVLTVFGPSYWIPRCKHLCGFARGHMLITDSPYFNLNRSPIEKLKEKIFYNIIKLNLKRCSDYFYTENPYITEKLKKSLSTNNVYTVTNYYNQVFDHKEEWTVLKLPEFKGFTMLTVTAAYPHKNLPIMLDMAAVFKSKYPDYNFRFVLTIDKSEFPRIPDELNSNFVFLGKVGISACPSLYEQADIMFQPTLLECFSATYPEAMKMGIPIVTTDLEFSRGLCGNAALYYPPLDANKAATIIYELCKNKDKYNELVCNGYKQLKIYDNYEQRVSKLIAILENIVNN